MPGDYARVAVEPTGGPATTAGRRSTTRTTLDVPPAEHPGTAPDDRLLLYFTSGTTSRPKLVEHTQVLLPRRATSSTMYWLGLRPGDVHLNIS